jgi:hypothetical protein
MKLWFRIALVCLASVSLLLSLSQQADSNYQLPVARSRPGLDRCRESAPSLPTAAVVKIMEFHPARAGPLESLVLDRALAESNIGPPYLETHGPPGQWNLWALASCWSSRQLKDKKQLIEQPISNLHEISRLQPTKPKNRRFAPGFS